MDSLYAARCCAARLAPVEEWGRRKRATLPETARITHRRLDFFFLIFFLFNGTHQITRMDLKIYCTKGKKKRKFHPHRLSVEYRLFAIAEKILCRIGQLGTKWMLLPVS